MQVLKVGDRTQDDSLVVLDEDRLCYRVRSISNGGVGVRTISKPLLEEWVEAYRATPNDPSQVVRERLVGKSEIDRFEYGYAGTLAKMAKMVLGQIPVVHPSVEELRQTEFHDWILQVEKKSAKTAKDTSRTYLPSISDDDVTRTPSVWHGLREYLYSEKPPKRLYAVENPAELEALYGGIDRLFSSDGEAEELDAQRFQECRDWANNPSNHNSVRAAWAMYKRFMQWREGRKAQEYKPLGTDDILTVALKMYAAARGREGPAGWESYDAWTHGVREEFAGVNEGWLEAEGFDYGEFMRKYAISWQVANSKFSVHTVEERRAVLGFLREQRAVPKAVSWYLEEGNRLKVGGKAVVGMGAATVLYFLSELRPEEFAAWSEPTYGALAFLGLHKGAVPPGLSVESYEDCKGKQRRIAERMGELGIGKASDDGSAADYRTVNEFLWWLKENQEAVQEVAMRKQLKDGKPTMHAGARKALSFAPDSKEDELLLRLLAALRAKPFAILAGHSGTGKSRYAKKLAYMTCNAVELRKEGQLPGNYLLLQVRPNWHDSTELLGFRNAMDGNRYQKTKLIEFLFRAYQFKETPFFLCLDEMNLAPVEQYFAEFLSSMESAEPVPLNDLSAEDDNLFELGCEWKAAYEHLAANGFSIPRNLFVVGTVNMDETTNQFSRKVLDRAFTIEMTDVDFRNYGHVAPPGYGDTIGEEMIQALLHGEKFVESLDPEDVADGAPLVRVQKALEPTAFAIAYRFANEYTLLKRAIACFDPSGAMKLDALDQAVLMKILPRVAGERDYIEQVYGRNENEGLRKALEGKAVSLGKIAEIMKRARDMNAQYITFWP